MFHSVVQLKIKKQKHKQQISSTRSAGTSIKILMQWVFWSFHGIYC